MLLPLKWHPPKRPALPLPKELQHQLSRLLLSRRLRLPSQSLLPRWQRRPPLRQSSLLQSSLPRLLLLQSSQPLWTCRLLHQQLPSQLPPSRLRLPLLRHKACCRSLKLLRLLPSRQLRKKWLPR